MTWSCEIIWLTTTIISPLLQCMWPLNLTRWWFALTGPHPQGQRTIWLRSLPRSRNKAKLSHLYYCKGYGHQTWQDRVITWKTPTHKVTQLFNHHVIEITSQIRLHVLSIDLFFWFLEAYFLLHKNNKISESLNLPSKLSDSSLLSVMCSIKMRKKPRSLVKVQIITVKFHKIISFRTISNIAVNRKGNGLTITRLCDFTWKSPETSLENFWDFEKLFWMVASKVISTGQKIFQIGNKFISISTIDVFTIISAIVNKILWANCQT